MASNLRNPPLFLRQSVIRNMLADLDRISGMIDKGVIPVPIAPIKLIDRPRASEDPRLAKANDDVADASRKPRAKATVSGRVAPPVASEPVPAAASEQEPEDWPDAPLPEHSDPDLDRSEPAQSKRKSRATGVQAAQRAAKAERDQAMLAAYAEGAEVADLAVRFGLAECTVREIAQDAGLRRRTGARPSKEIAARNAEVAEALAGGEPIGAICERFGLSHTNVYAIGKKAGVNRKAVTRADIAAKTGAVLAAIRRGEAVADIAEWSGYNSSHIYQIAKKAGVPIPRPQKAPKPPKAPRQAKPKVPAKVSVSIHRGETPPPAIVEAAAEKLRQVASDNTGEFFSDAAVKRRAQQAGRSRVLAERDAAAARRAERRAERAADDAEAIDEFREALNRAAQRRESGVTVIAPVRAAAVRSGARLAEALRRRDEAKRAQQQSATDRVTRVRLLPAQSRGECPRCGIPGWRGCAHQLPHEAGPPPVYDEPVDHRLRGKERAL